jgi:4,5-dihydroxyphthalate decarboxylase
MASVLTLACGDYDRTRAVLDGRIGVEGYTVSVLKEPIKDSFARALRDGDIDITEMSMNSFLAAKANGGSPYIGLPVFTARSFRHSAIYIRTDRGIRGPADLAGRTVGLAEYANTAALVVRGMLKDEFGVTPESIRWRVGDVEAPERKTIPLPSLPNSIDIQAVPGKSLAAMLTAGEIDALIVYQPPSCFGKVRGVARLFADPRAVEQDYFRRTGHFPIMHGVLVRKALVDGEPGLARKIFTAFGKAKALAEAELQGAATAKIMLPWFANEAQATRELMGDDFWPYGLERNRSGIETLARYAHEQHVTSRRLSVDELFVDSAKG